MASSAFDSDLLGTWPLGHLLNQFQRENSRKGKCCLEGPVEQLTWLEPVAPNFDEFLENIRRGGC